MDPLVAQFQSFVVDLTTVERRNILALTTIAKDALRTHPHLVPNLAKVLENRIIQAPPDAKLPPLYLLDSIAKTVGEPYKSCFAAGLPEIFSSAWNSGAPGLRRPLEKLLTTWSGVFPPPVLEAIGARTYAAPPAIAPGNGYPGYPPPQLPAYDYYGAAVHKPMVPDARLIGQQPMAGFGAALPQPQPEYGYAAAVPGYAAAQPYPAAPVPTLAPVQLPPAADLLSLLSSVTSQAAATAAAAAGQPRKLAAEAKGRPQTLELSNETIKEHNPAAVDRLLTISERTKSNFLDRKFLRRQNQGSGLRASRLWYVDLDTWMAGTTGAVQQGTDAAAEAAAAAGGVDQAQPEERFSVPADDEQTHCALSGERFDQFWDEEHQEWRYREARKLDADEAACYGLEEGVIVLVSALGGGPPQVKPQPAAAGVKKEEGKEEEAAGEKRKADATEEPEAKRVKTED